MIPRIYCLTIDKWNQLQKSEFCLHAVSIQIATSFSSYNKFVVHLYNNSNINNNSKGFISFFFLSFLHDEIMVKWLIFASPPTNCTFASPLHFCNIFSSQQDQERELHYLGLSTSPLHFCLTALPEALAINTFALLNFYATFCLPIGPTSYHFCKLNCFLFCQKYWNVE